MATVERGDSRFPHAFRQRDERRIGSTQRKVSVLLDEVGASCQVLVGRRFNRIAS